MEVQLLGVPFTRIVISKEDPQRGISGSQQEGMYLMPFLDHSSV